MTLGQRHKRAKGHFPCLPPSESYIRKQPFALSTSVRPVTLEKSCLFAFLFSFVCQIPPALLASHSSLLLFLLSPPPSDAIRSLLNGDYPRVAIRNIDCDESITCDNSLRNLSTAHGLILGPWRLISSHEAALQHIARRVGHFKTAFILLAPSRLDGRR